jgi:hypothetical protein
VSLVAACTSDPTESSTESGAGSTRGLTDDTIRIGYLGADFGALADAGVAPDLGDQRLVTQAFVDDINAAGGIAGREIELDVQLFDPLAPEAGAEACLALTQDFGAFAVIAGPGTGLEPVECVTVANDTLLLGSVSAPDSLLEEADGRLWDLSMSPDRLQRGWVADLDERGVLDGRVGVVTSDDQGRSDIVESALVPALEELGHDPVATVVLPCAEGDSDCDQHESAVQQLKDAGADVVLVDVTALAYGPLFEAARNLDFDPQWSLAGNWVTDTVAAFYEGSRDVLEGATGLSTFDLGPQDGSLPPTPEWERACNEIAAAAGAAYEEGTDAFGFAGTVCQLLRLFQRAAGSVDGEVGQASVIRALGELGTLEPDEPDSWSWGPDKHDAGDVAWLAEYDTRTGRWFSPSREPVDLSDA